MKIRLGIDIACRSLHHAEADHHDQRDEERVAALDEKGHEDRRQHQPGCQGHRVHDLESVPDDLHDQQSKGEQTPASEAREDITVGPVAVRKEQVVPNGST